jgi:phage shock protein A
LRTTFGTKICKSVNYLFFAHLGVAFGPTGRIFNAFGKRMKKTLANFLSQQNMAEQRNRSMEQMLQESERELGIVQGRFTKLKEDFTFNLNLFAERDAELNRAEDALDELRASGSQKDNRIAELEAQVQPISQRTAP